MRKYVIFSFLVGLFFFFISCEVDDICIEKVITPKMIVKFYDAAAPTKVKKITGIYVWAEGKDSLYISSSVDSISIPLNTLTNSTKYLLSVDKIVDTLIVNYDKTNVFVSRSCGYKTNFSISSVPYLSQHWTMGIELNETPQPIENEFKAHVKIYH
jgi:hypothetical protein